MYASDQMRFKIFLKEEQKHSMAKLAQRNHQSESGYPSLFVIREKQIVSNFCWKFFRAAFKLLSIWNCYWLHYIFLLAFCSKLNSPSHLFWNVHTIYLCITIYICNNTNINWLKLLWNKRNDSLYSL